jgi:peroxiredoxin-like protein
MTTTPSHRYSATARWTTERRGVVKSESVAGLIEFSAPPEFQGEAGLWTPEHFLVAAVASCFVTTFRAIAEFSKFEPVALDVSAEGVVEKAEKGFRFTRVVLRPVLTIGTEADRERGLRLLEKAERSCLVSRSLQSELTLEPAVQVAAAVTAE